MVGLVNVQLSSACFMVFATALHSFHILSCLQPYLKWMKLIFHLNVLNTISSNGKGGKNFLPIFANLLKTTIQHVYKQSQPLLNILLKYSWQQLQAQVIFRMVVYFWTASLILHCRSSQGHGGEHWSSAIFRSLQNVKSVQV